MNLSTVFKRPGVSAINIPDQGRVIAIRLCVLGFLIFRNAKEKFDVIYQRIPPCRLQRILPKLNLDLLSGELQCVDRMESKRFQRRWNAFAQ